MASELQQVSAENILTGLLSGAVQNPDNFVARKFLPVIPATQTYNNGYYKIDVKSFNQKGMKTVGDGAKTPIIDFKTEKKTFDLTTTGATKMVTERYLKNIKDVLNYENATVNFLLNQARINADVDFAETMFKDNVWDTDILNKDWTTAGSTPVEDIREALIGVSKDCGHRANRVLVSAPVHECLCNHPDVLNRMKTTTDKSVTTEVMARLLDVDKYIVGSGTYYNEAADSMEYIFSDSVLVAYVNETAPAVDLPSAGYFFEGEGVVGSMTVSTYDDKSIKSVGYNIENEIDICVVSEACGAFLKDVLG